MEDTLISFETAKLAKEKGFDWSVSWYATHKRKAPTNPDSFYPELSTFKNWNNNEDLNFYDRYSTPTQSLLQKWLREIYGIHIHITLWISMDREYCYNANLTREMCFDKDDNLTLYYSDFKDGRWRVNEDVKIEYDSQNTHEKALEKGLQEALKLIK